MNIQAEWKTTARIADPERKAFWEGIFGSDIVPVTSIIPQWVTVPGYATSQLAYMLDLAAISQEQRKKLCLALAEKFGFAVGYVRERLDEVGVPVLVVNVAVVTRDYRQLLSLLDD